MIGFKVVIPTPTVRIGTVPNSGKRAQDLCGLSARHCSPATGKFEEGSRSLALLVVPCNFSNC